MPKIRLAQPLTSIVTLLAGAFVVLINQTLLVAALPTIAQDMGVGVSVMQWLVTGYLLINGVIVPVSAFCIRRWATRRLFLGMMALVLAGTVVVTIGAVSGQFWLLLVGRLVQAVGSGVAVALCQAALLALLPGRQALAISLSGLALGVSLAIGPTVGGVITMMLGWQALFWLLIPVLVGLMLVARAGLSDVTGQEQPTLDWRSIAYSTVGFGGVLYAVSSLEAAALTQPLFWVPLLVGVVGVVAFVRRQLRLPDPVLDMAIVRDPVVWRAATVSAIVTVSLVGAEVIIPVLLGQVVGLGAFQIGLAMMPGAVLMVALTAAADWLYSRYGGWWLSLVGMTVITAMNLVYALVGPTDVWMVAMIYAVRMIGVGLVLAPVVTLGMSRLPARLTPHGTALFATYQQIGGAVGTAVLVAVMTLVATVANQTGPAAAALGVRAAFAGAAVVTLVALGLLLGGARRSNQQP